MKELFLNFIQEPTKESFLELRSFIINHDEYEPYSEDIRNINNLLRQNNFRKVALYTNINILLSPRAHMYKSFALKKLNDEDGADMESNIGQTILEGIQLTGNGSLEKPYLVTRIDDERDFLKHIEEVFVSQALVNDIDKSYDCITTASGKNIYFDITDCFKKMTIQFSNREINMDEFLKNLKPEPIKKVKPWWKIW
jgi:hypothetical protein